MRFAILAVLLTGCGSYISLIEDESDEPYKSPPAAPSEGDKWILPQPIH